MASRRRESCGTSSRGCSARSAPTSSLTTSLAASRAHHADLIVHDAMLYAGPPVAASLGESTNTGAVKVCKVAG